MACDCSCGEDCNDIMHGIGAIQGFISGIVGSLRTDVYMGKRTQNNADEIISYLMAIDDRLGRI